MQESNTRCSPDDHPLSVESPRVWIRAFFWVLWCVAAGWTLWQASSIVSPAQHLDMAWLWAGWLAAAALGLAALWPLWPARGKPHAVETTMPANVEPDHVRELAVASPGPEPEMASTAVMTPTEQELLRYAISHDLRAPLRVIEGFGRLIKEEEGPRMDRMSNEHLDRLLAAAGRMNTMIDAILAQAQLNQTVIERRSIDLTALAHQLVSDLKAASPSAPAAGCTTSPVTWVVVPGMHATGDPDMVRRILENLLSNAAKYSSKVAQPRVEIGMVEAADPKVYYVRDNGAGFDMQHAQKLFGLFQRLHSNKEFPGSGVGLAGVQIMVRRHGGRIWAEASPGQGACFYFTLAAPARH